MSAMADLDIELRQALRAVEKRIAWRDEWMDENSDDEGEPTMSYSRWDESLADHAYSIADAGEALAGVVRKLIGEDE